MKLEGMKDGFKEESFFFFLLDLKLNGYDTKE